MTLKNEIKVSVTMPAYNAARYIKEAIESVLAQDYNPFELLIADDASIDDTFGIIQRYRRHPKVRIFTHQKNLGVGAARNRLIRLARGQYITPCDADDLMLSGNLKRLSEFLDLHPRFGVVYANVLALEVNKENQLLQVPQVYGTDCRRVWDLNQNVINHPGSMIRKSLILKVGGYDETVYSVDDWSLWLRLAEVTKFKYLEKEIYYLWRRNPMSITRTDKKYGADVLKIIKETTKRRYGIQL